MCEVRQVPPVLHRFRLQYHRRSKPVTDASQNHSPDALTSIN
ncbi:hypothetical protein CGMCC3_g4055 [Colletotrichum fructicola]|nr:uncharacterized protein CGMCC3_g4055 [Colletotrichum fructicola]KAE9580168.1 hypothetical protein CGMCC3_g4055 [Colletotrichum fructicola]